MSTSVARVGRAFRGRSLAWLVVLIGLCSVAALVVLATRLGTLPMALALVVVASTLVGVCGSLVLLLAFAALIPVEEVAMIEGLGTISGLAGICSPSRMACLGLGA